MGLSTRATLAARHRLAHWTGDAGDAAGARDQYTALLHVFERVVGPEHPDTLTARGNLAHWTGEAGDAAGARDQYAALLPIRERESGAEHLDTLTARGNLARWTGEAGNAAAARDQFAALLPIEEQILTTLRRWPSAPTSPTTRGRRGTLPGPATSTQPCCPSASGCWAPTTATPWPPAITSPTGPGRLTAARTSYRQHCCVARAHCTPLTCA